MAITIREGNNELNIQLTPLPPPTANLYGVVKDAQTGTRLGGVKITLDGVVTYTNTDGEYAFVGLTPGSYTISFEKTGYQTLVM